MILIASLLAATVHHATVDHRGQRYQVAHRPHVETRAKTVGAATGSKPSMQRCRWTATVQVERTIARAGEGAGVTTLLPASRTLEGDRHGACMGDVARNDAVEDRRVRAAAGELVAAARDDRATTLAAIDAAHTLSAN